MTARLLKVRLEASQTLKGLGFRGLGFRVYIGVILGLYCVYIGFILDLYWVCTGVIIGLYWGYWDDGKENGNYYLGSRV